MPARLCRAPPLPPAPPSAGTGVPVVDEMVTLHAAWTKAVCWVGVSLLRARPSRASHAARGVSFGPRDAVGDGSKKARRKPITSSVGCDSCGHAAALRCRPQVADRSGTRGTHPATSSDAIMDVDNQAGARTAQADAKVCRPACEQLQWCYGYR